MLLWHRLGRIADWVRQSAASLVAHARPWALLVGQRLLHWQRTSEVRTVGLLLLLALAGYAAGSRSTRPPHRPLTTVPPKVATTPITSAGKPRPSADAANGQTPATRESPPLPMPSASPPSTTMQRSGGPHDEPGRWPAVLVEHRSQWHRVAHLPFQPDRLVADRQEAALLWIVPPGGLVVEADQVCFRNVHFAADPYQDPGTQTGPVVELRVQHCRFERCSFQTGSEQAGNAFRPAILWRGAARNGNALPTAGLELVDCVFRSTGPGVQVALAGAARLSLTNCLVVSPAAAIAWDQPLGAEEPWRIDFERSTFRGPGSLLEMPLLPGSRGVGEVHIVSQNSVLAMDRLLLIAGTGQPARTLRSLRWSGQGSLLAEGSQLVQWQSRPQELVEVNDRPLEVAGMVRSRLTFAGLELGPISDSVLEDWQAPLFSEETPGIDTGRLWYPAAPE